MKEILQIKMESAGRGNKKKCRKYIALHVFLQNWQVAQLSKMAEKMRLTWCKKDDYTGFNLHRIVAKKYVKKQWRCVKKNMGVFFMEAVNLKKLETAILYIQRIADGKNPINNVVAEEDSVLNDPNIIRCMYFAKEVLEEVKKNNGYIGKKKSKKDMLEFPVESLALFQYREDKPVTKFVEQINEAVDTNIYQKFSYRWITQWLKKNEYLKEDFHEELQKVVTMPTEKGEQIGIRAEKKKSLNGNEYLFIVYGKEAQEFVVEHVEEIMEGRG